MAAVNDSGPPIAADQEALIEFLRCNGNKKQFARVAKRGVPEGNILGTPKGFVTRAAKTLGKDQKLAQALWRSGFHEARLLAVLLADPKKISFATVKQWSRDLWSWDLTDQIGRYLVPWLAFRDQAISHCLQAEATFTRRLAFSGIACSVLHCDDIDDPLARYADHVRIGAQDSRHHVRNAVVWALVEMGKTGEHNQELAIVFAAELIEEGGASAWVGKNALRELEALVSVPERRRLLASNSD